MIANLCRLLAYATGAGVLVASGLLSGAVIAWAVA
jgi:hypothetical protein